MQEPLEIQISPIYASKLKLWNSTVAYSPKYDCLWFPRTCFSSLKHSCSFSHTNILSTMVLTYRWFKLSWRRYEKLLVKPAGLLKWQTGQDPGDAMTESQKRILCIVFNPVFQQKPLLLYCLRRGRFSIIFRCWSVIETSYRFIPSFCICLIITASFGSCFSGHALHSDGWLIHLFCPSNQGCICHQKSTGLHISMLKDNLDQ